MNSRNFLFVASSGPELCVEFKENCTLQEIIDEKTKLLEENNIDPGHFFEKNDLVIHSIHPALNEPKVELVYDFNPEVYIPNKLMYTQDPIKIDRSTTFIVVQSWDAEYDIRIHQNTTLQQVIEKENYKAGEYDSDKDDLLILKINEESEDESTSLVFDYRTDVYLKHAG
ncbi:hypothetical protein [Priestia aryabhattai]